MIKQEFLVATHLAWEPTNQLTNCLVTWEVFGGGLMGNLLTDSANIELSLWPETKYIVQVTCKNKVSIQHTHQYISYVSFSFRMLFFLLLRFFVEIYCSSFANSVSSRSYLTRHLIYWRWIFPMHSVCPSVCLHVRIAHCMLLIHLVRRDHTDSSSAHNSLCSQSHSLHEHFNWNHSSIL